MGGWRHREPEANLQLDLGNEVVDDMMVEMRQMQQENMVSVVLKVDDRTGIPRILSNNHNIMLPLQKMPSQSTTQASSKQSHLKLMNEGMQFSECCSQEHELAIAYEPEDDSKYCHAPYFLYNVKCKGCGKQVVEHLTDESSENKKCHLQMHWKYQGVQDHIV